MIFEAKRNSGTNRLRTALQFKLIHDIMKTIKTERRQNEKSNIYFTVLLNDAQRRVM